MKNATQVAGGRGTVDASDEAAPIARWVSLCVQLVTLLYFAVSPSLLEMYGWQYADTGGSVVEKVHLATIILFALFAALLAAQGNPLTALEGIMQRHVRCIPYLLGIGFMTWWAARVVGVPFTMFIETFVPAFVLLVLLRDVPEDLGRRLALIIHTVLLANSLLAICESALHFRTIPLVINGEPIDYETDPRSTALMGHPLANAVITGSYLLALTFGGGRDLPAWLRPFIYLISAVSLAVYGGRAATALLVVFMIGLALAKLYTISRGGRFDTRGVLAGLVVVPLVGLLAVGLNEVGFFDTFLSRVADDAGSADTRVVMFDLFKHQNWHDLILMPDPEMLSTWARLYGTELGIESFVVQYALTYGILATAIFLPALLSFCLEVTRAARPGAAVVLLYFFIVALTSVSLSAKNAVFTSLVLMILVLLRHSPPAEGVTAADAADDTNHLSREAQ